MCGFDALMYAVCRSPAELAAPAAGDPDWASTRTTTAAAAINPMTTATLTLVIMSASEYGYGSIPNFQLPTPKESNSQEAHCVDFNTPWKLAVGDWEFTCRPQAVPPAAARSA